MQYVIYYSVIVDSLLMYLDTHIYILYENAGQTMQKRNTRHSLCNSSEWIFEYVLCDSNRFAIPILLAKGRFHVERIVIHAVESERIVTCWVIVDVCVCVYIRAFVWLKGLKGASAAKHANCYENA